MSEIETPVRVDDRGKDNFEDANKWCEVLDADGKVICTIYDIGCADKANTIRDALNGRARHAEAVRLLEEAKTMIYCLGAGPIALAVKYGPDFEPPDDEAIVEMWDALDAFLAAELKGESHDCNRQR